MGLQEDYQNLLKKYNLSHSQWKYDKEQYARWSEESSREFAQQHELSEDYEPPFGNLISESLDNIKKEGTSAELVNNIIEISQKGFEKILTEQKIKLDFPLMIAQFPTGTVNAQVVKVPSGILVLVNEGILSMITKIVKFIFMASEIEQKSKNKRDVIYDNHVRLLDMILHYVLTSDARTSTGLPAMPPQLGTIIGSVLSGAYQFVFAHEYAHVINGDLNGNAYSTTTLSTPVGNIDVIKQSWEKESEADLTAMKILINKYQNIKQDREISSLDCNFLLGGSLVFFEIGTFIEFVTWEILGLENEPTYKLYPTHPPSMDRSQNIRKYLENILTQEEMDYSTAVADEIMNRMLDSLQILKDNKHLLFKE